jgi:hypothetical protein
MLGLFGIVRAEETTTTEAVVEETSTITVSGELSTDITFGDATTFSSPYTGLTFSGDGWVVSTNLLDGEVNIEEANYSWSPVDFVTLTFGSQAEPYGLAWGLHRPSNNWFVSTPRDHNVTNGVGVGVDKFGVGANFFYGGSTEDVLDEEGVVTEEGSQYWATRVSYGRELFGIDSKFGLSLNSNESQLVDVSLGNDLFSTSLEYDLSEEADGAYWLRGVVTPPQAQGAFLLIGYNSDEVVTYGVGYKCSDNMKVVSEFTSGLKDAEGNEVENDFSIRASYSF